MTDGARALRQQTGAIPIDGANPDGANPDGDNPDDANPDGANPDDANPDDASADGAPNELPWRRLAPGMLLVEPLREIIRFIPMLLILLFAGRAGDSGPPWGLIGTAAVIALGISRWVTTRYRITPTVVEVRRGVFQRKHLTVPRDRVRTVDVSAHPLQRALHLVKIRIGTGTAHQGAEGLALDGLPASAAGPLRAELLHRLPVGGATPAQRLPDADQRTDPDETELARLDPRWIRFAPATLSGVLSAAFLIGLGWRLINEASVNPAQFPIVRQAIRHLQGTPLWVDVVQGAAVVILVVTVLSLGGYVVSFWGYRLLRHAGGTLQVSRGLLTTRATSIEERRLYGVERSEPLLLRAVRGARLNAIATGLRERGSDRGSALLVPPAPIATVLRVEAEILKSAGPDGPGSIALVPHGPAARRRRYTRALGVTVGILTALVVLIEWAHWPVQLAAPAPFVLLGAAALAHDRYRNLGSAIARTPAAPGGEPRVSLVVRTGSLVRRRHVLAVPGVIGVTLRQSFFQRRNGLVSLTATTAAGAQHYAVPDLPEAMAGEVLPVLLPQSVPLLRQSPSSS